MGATATENLRLDETIAHKRISRPNVHEESLSEQVVGHTRWYSCLYVYGIDAGKAKKSKRKGEQAIASCNGAGWGVLCLVYKFHTKKVKSIPKKDVTRKVPL